MLKWIEKADCLYHSRYIGRDTIMLSIENWPILVVSHRFDAQTDPGMRLREITKRLEEERGLPVLRSWSYTDAKEIFTSRSDLSCVLVDWDITKENIKENMEDQPGVIRPSSLVRYIHKRNAHLPILLLTDDMRLKRSAGARSADDPGLHMAQRGYR